MHKLKCLQSSCTIMLLKVQSPWEEKRSIITESFFITLNNNNKWHIIFIIIWLNSTSKLLNKYIHINIHNSNTSPLYAWKNTVYKQCIGLVRYSLHFRLISYIDRVLNTNFTHLCYSWGEKSIIQHCLCNLFLQPFTERACVKVKWNIIIIIITIFILVFLSFVTNAINIIKWNLGFFCGKCVHDMSLLAHWFFQPLILLSDD